VWILQDFVIPESQYAKASIGKITIAKHIARAASVLTAIGFHNKMPIE